MTLRMIAPVSTLVLVRHELRQMRVQDAMLAMLAPKVVPPTLGPDQVFCPRCGTPKKIRVMCRVCPNLKSYKRSSETGYKRGATALGISVDEYRQHREAGEKRCSFHKTWEPESAFGKGPRADGLAGYCRRASKERYDRATTTGRMP